jgi:DNA-binding MarR family transcriptional regulator
MTRIIGSLDSLGLLDRRPDPADGRAWLLVPSEAGAELMQRIRSGRTAYLARQLDTLDADALAALIAAVPVLEALVQEPPGN